MPTEHATTRAASCAPEQLDDAIAIARRYLIALEARDIDTAQSLLATDAVIAGPGGKPARRVDDIVRNSSQRYQAIGKHFERFEAFAVADGTIVVYSLGTLHGRWIDGSAFSGIRYIDRFVVRGDVIASQEVWNDTAEHRLRRQAAAAVSPSNPESTH